MMKSKVSRMIYVIMATVLLMSAFAFSGCTSYTEEEHIQRITERVGKRFMGDDPEQKEALGRYTSFAVEIVYSVDEEKPKFFLVEFYPSGFLCGTIYKNEYYLRDDEYCRGSWHTDVPVAPSNFYASNWSGGWEDENGVRQYRSHYSNYGFSDQKKFMRFTHKLSAYFDPCVKLEDGKYQSLSDISSIPHNDFPKWAKEIEKKHIGEIL